LRWTTNNIRPGRLSLGPIHLIFEGDSPINLRLTEDLGESERNHRRGALGIK
jgi:hypothetical protein